MHVSILYWGECVVVCFYAHILKTIVKAGTKTKLNQMLSSNTTKHEPILRQHISSCLLNLLGLAFVSSIIQIYSPPWTFAATESNKKAVWRLPLPICDTFRQKFWTCMTVVWCLPIFPAQSCGMMHVATIHCKILYLICFGHKAGCIFCLFKMEAMPSM